MKNLIIISLAIFLLSFQSSCAQEKNVHEQEIMIDENTVIKDESGNRVEMQKFIEYMESGEWTIDPVNGSDGKMEYLQLRKATEEEKKMFAEMPPMNENNELIGKKAPKFILTDMNGNKITSKNTKGKVVVLNFWFTTCKPCISEIPEINELYEKYKDNKDVVFASITFNREKEVNTFLEKYPIKLPIVADAQHACKLFHVVAFPTNVVIDKKGKYADFIMGGFPQIGVKLDYVIQKALK